MNDLLRTDLNKQRNANIGKERNRRDRRTLLTAVLLEYSKRAKISKTEVKQW